MVFQNEKNNLQNRKKEIKDREINIKREIEELFFKPIISSIDDMDKLEPKKNKENKTN